MADEGFVGEGNFTVIGQVAASSIVGSTVTATGAVSGETASANIQMSAPAGVFTNITCTNINGKAAGTAAYTVLTITTGDLAPAATYDLQLNFGYSRVIVDWAQLTLTAGTANAISAVLYDGDPAAAGVAKCPIYGSTFSSFMGWTSPVKGMSQTYGGSTGLTGPVSLESNSIYIRITNQDGANNGTFEIKLWGRQIPNP